MADFSGTSSDLSCRDAKVPYSHLIGKEEAHPLDFKLGVITFLLGQPFLYDRIVFGHVKHF